MPKYAVERSIVIEKNPQDVFEFVSDFGSWTKWSPWLCAEPEAKVTVSDNTNSIGSKYTWDGKIVGAGELEHLTLEPGKRIIDEIRFLRPFKSKAEVVFHFEPAGSGTKAIWQMNGSLPWFMFWMKSMMKSFISMDYDRGLKMMKEYMETGGIKSKTQNKGVQSVGPLRMAGVRRSCKMDEISSLMESDISDAKQKLEQHGVETKDCVSVYHDFKISSQIMDYTSGFVVDQATDIPGINNWQIDSVQALRVDHIGSYNHLGNAWFAANQIARNTGLKQSKVGTFEIYRNDPCEVAEEDIVTEIYLPLK